MSKIARLTSSTLAITLLTGSLAFVACSSDDGIDLNEIDNTIGIGADGFELPSSSTNAIKLADVLTLNDGDCVQVLSADSGIYKKGDYQFKKTDDIAAAAPKVKQVSFANPVVVPSPIPVLFTPAMAQAKGQDIDFPLPIEGPETVADFSFTGQSDASIVKLLEATIDGKIDMTVSLKSIQALTSQITIDLYIPKYFKLAPNSYQLEQPDGEYNILKIDDLTTDADKTIQLVITNLQDFCTEKPTGASSYLLVNRSTVELKGLLKMQMHLNAKYFKDGVEEAKIMPKLYNVDVKNVDLGNKMTISKAKGYFDPAININPSHVEIGNGIPDFLTDDKVKINLANPVLKLQVENNLDVKAIVDAKLVAYYDEAKKDSLFMHIDGITIQPHKGDVSATTTTKIAICREAGSDPGITYIVKNNPEDKKEGKAQETGDIGQMLQRIPKSFSFVINAHTDLSDLDNPELASSIELYDPAKEGQPGAPGLQYKIKPAYEFVAPFDLNPNSTIVYNDTIDDWNKDIVKNEIELYEGKVHVNANIYNGTPLQLEMTPYAIGLDKKVLQKIHINVIGGTGNTLTVPSHFGQAEGSTTSPIQLEIVRDDGGSLKDLDGLKFSIEASTKTRGTLNSESQKIIIKDIKVKIDGKISINPESKD